MLPLWNKMYFDHQAKWYASAVLQGWQKDKSLYYCSDVTAVVYGKGMASYILNLGIRHGWKVKFNLGERTLGTTEYEDGI